MEVQHYPLANFQLKKEMFILTAEYKPVRTAYEHVGGTFIEKSTSETYSQRSFSHQGGKDHQFK